LRAKKILQNDEGMIFEQIRKGVIKMSKKNYIAIAKVLREVRTKHPVSNDTFENIVDSLANVLKEDNSRFQYTKFWDYVNK